MIKLVSENDDSLWCVSRAPAGFKNVDAQPVGSGESLREMIRNIDNYFAIG